MSPGLDSPPQNNRRTTFSKKFEPLLNGPGGRSCVCGAGRRLISGAQMYGGYDEVGKYWINRTRDAIGHYLKVETHCIKVMVAS